jgi:PAS domain S-box-containing protein
MKTRCSRNFQYLKLLENEEKYRTLVENANDGIYLRSKEGILEFVNDKFLEIHGYSREEVIGKPSWYFLHPDDLKEISEPNKPVTEIGSGFRGESRIITKNGTLKHVEINTVPIKTSDGIEKALGITRDITDKRKYQEELKNAHERLLKVLDSIEAVIYVANLETYDVLFMNNYAKTIHNYKTGQKCWEIFHSKQKSVCEFCPNNKLLDKNGNPKEAVIWENYNEGVEKWFQYSDKAIQWIDGKLVKLHIAFDITERKKAEKELIDSEEKFRKLFENQGEGVGIVNLNEEFVFTNPAAEKIFGVKKGKLNNRSLREFTSKENFNKLKKETKQHKKGENIHL